MEALPVERENLRRRNSNSTAVVVPEKLTILTKPHLSASFSNGCGGSSAASPPDLALITMIGPFSYTSLKDLLPSMAVNSPTASSAAGSDLGIRNRLVKQAAWAYLQPSASPSSRRSTADHFFALRIWPNFAALIRFVTRTLTRAYQYLIRSTRIWCCT
ncbi:uncharacterized protein LOC127806353 [Diospyros lotus]|uniref:uncharacterized protein LOC127806353 n=1 Tax=Diospyros lotus TaxID=55363 RepID=UPI00224DFB4A|nr:uncharacterized protein LOC127806353 [Diospyros lotus]